MKKRKTRLRNHFGASFGLESVDAYGFAQPVEGKRGNYKTLLMTLMKRYGIESSYIVNRYGLEDLEVELDASENTEEEIVENDTGEVFAEDDDSGVEEGETVGVDDTALPDESSIGEGDSTDIQDVDSSNGDEVVWDNVDIENLQSDADAINMMEIVGNYHNDYIEYMETFLKKNSEILDLSGDFTQSPFYPTIEQAMKFMDGIYKEAEEFKVLSKLLELLKDKRKMTSICGTDKNPFLYEGFQLIFLEYSRSLLALWPFCLKQNCSPTDVIESLDLKVIRSLRQMAEDVVEVQSLYGSTIFYIEPIVSDITGKSEELAGTPYIESPVFKKDPMDSTMTFSGESIMNLIEIKNQNALPEYSILAKACMVIAGLVKLVQYKSIYTDLLENVIKICSTNDTEAIEGMVEDAMGVSRQKVFMPQIEAMAELSRIEQNKTQEKSAE